MKKGKSVPALPAIRGTRRKPVIASATRTLRVEDPEGSGDSDDSAENRKTFWRTLKPSSTTLGAFFSKRESSDGTSPTFSSASTEASPGPNSSFSKWPLDLSPHMSANKLFSPKSGLSPSTLCSPKSLPNVPTMRRVSAGNQNVRQPPLRRHPGSKTLGKCVREPSQLPADMALEIISNLDTRDIGNLPAVSQSMVEFSCNQTDDRKSRWLIVPCVTIRRDEDIAKQLYRMWPPCMSYIEARHVRTADVCFMLSELNKPEDGARGLKVLDLSYSKLPPNNGAGRNALPAYLRAATCLRELNLCHCQVTSEVLDQLTRALTRHSDNGRMDPIRSLEELILRDNEIRSNGARHLATLIQHLRLKRLVVAKNKLQDEGAEVLVPALRLSEDLLNFDISTCSLSALGVIAVIESLEANSILRVLNIGGHPLAGEMRNDELIEALGKARGLKELHLWGCGIQDQAFDAIIGSKPFGMRVNLASNRFSVDLRMRLLQMEQTSPAFAQTMNEVQL